MKPHILENTGKLEFTYVKIYLRGKNIYYNAAMWELIYIINITALIYSYLHSPFIKGFLPFIGPQGTAQEPVDFSEDYEAKCELQEKTANL